MDLRERGQRLLEEAVFHLWVGAGVVLSVVIGVRWFFEPAKLRTVTRR